jgi:hypothetical protein
MRRLGLFVIAVAVAAGCGRDAVTDPLDEGFDADPRPVLGSWAVDLPTPPGTFDALLERGVGTLSGYFEFELWGRWWVVRFRDATWDGETVRFVVPTDFGQREEDSLVYWEARYIAPRTAPNPSPPMIQLTASFGPGRNCCIVMMTYQRPGAIASSVP